MRVVLAESIAMMAIGDGVLGALFPVQHATRWDVGPDMWRKYMRFYADRPELTRLLSLAEVAAGIACAAMLPSKPR